MVSTLIFFSAVCHLAVFVAYPHSGRFAFPFLAVSMILWTGFAIFMNRAMLNARAGWKAALAAGFILMSAFSALSFVPQKDGISALRKFTSGVYPDNRTLYVGLRRIGIDAPRLLPPQKEETLP